MQQAGGGGGESLLQNKKVQIGIIAVGAIALIAVAVMFLMPSGGGDNVPPPVDPAMAGAPGPGTGAPGPGGPGGMPGEGAMPGPEAGVGGAPGMGAAPGMPGAYTAPGGGTAPSMVSAGTGGTPGGASSAEKALPKGPGVPVRTNPFEENADLKRAIKSIPGPPPALPEAIAPEINVYAELNPPEPGEIPGQENPGPPIPPMRVAGVVFGAQVTATLQIGGEYMQVRPGQMIPDGNPVYRVERIEHDRVELVRRWQIRDQSGVQRFEVMLQNGNPQQGAGFAGGMGFRPGMAGNGPSRNGPGF